MRDSIRSSLSQPVTRNTRHWRFNRRHLLGTRPSTNAKWCWATRRRGETGGPDTSSPPDSQARTRPNWSDSGEERSRRPPLALRLPRDPRPPAATQRTLYPIQKVTEIYHKVTEMYKKVTELQISCWNVLFRLWSEVAYIGTGPILP